MTDVILFKCQAVVSEQEIMESTELNPLLILLLYVTEEKYGIS